MTISNLKVISRLGISGLFDTELRITLTDLIQESNLGGNVELAKKEIVVKMRKEMKAAYRLGVAQGKKEAEL